MKKGFICPSGKEILFEDCLKEGGCANRCMSRSSLKLLSEVRPWKGKSSTTQLLNGTMMEYLKIKHDYYISPQGNAFAILGTRVHGGLANADDEVSLLEEKLEDEHATGTFDFLEPENGVTTLGDHKVCGYYKVLRAIGYYSVDVEAGKYKTGKRKGETRYEKQWLQARPDCFEWTMQLNKYRMDVERAGFKVDKLKIEAIIRDFNTSPKIEGRYILNPISYFDIERLSDDYVKSYFAEKNDTLMYALKNGWDKPCSEAERWNGKRCEKYCSVSHLCQFRSLTEQGARQVARIA